MEQNAAFATSISLHKRKRGHGSSTYVEQTFEPEQELLEALAQTRMEISIILTKVRVWINKKIK